MNEGTSSLSNPRWWTSLIEDGWRILDGDQRQGATSFRRGGVTTRGVYRGTRETPACTGDRVVSQEVVGVTGVGPREGDGPDPRHRRDGVSSGVTSLGRELVPSPVSSRHLYSFTSHGLILVPGLRGLESSLGQGLN